MVKCLPEFEYFYCIFEKKQQHIISKLRRSKVTDYAALMVKKPCTLSIHLIMHENV